MAEFFADKFRDTNLKGEQLMLHIVLKAEAIGMSVHEANAVAEQAARLLNR